MGCFQSVFCSPLPLSLTHPHTRIAIGIERLPPICQLTNHRWVEMSEPAEVSLDLVPAQQQEFLPLAKVDSRTRTPWRTKVMVLEKTMPKNSQTSRTTYQRLTLSDESGTKIQAIIYGEDIENFKNTLIVMRQYIIRNAPVTHCALSYRSTPHPFQLTINSKAIIDEVIEGPTPTYPVNDFTPFAQLESCRHGQLIDIIGAVIDTIPPHFTKPSKGSKLVQEFLLLDIELKPKILTLWNQYVNKEGSAIAALIETKPIVAAFRVRVTSQHGTSVSTWNTTSFIINPDFPEAIELKASIIAEEDLVAELVESKILKKRLEESNNNEIPKVQVVNLQNVPINQTYSVVAKLTPRKLVGKGWYMACSKCFKATSAECNEVYTCYTCRSTDTFAAPRARIDAKLEDSTGCIEGAFYGPDAETLIGSTSFQLFEATNQGKLSELAAKISNATQPEQVLYVRIYNRNNARQFAFSFPPIINSLDQPVAIEATPTASSDTIETTRLNKDTGQQIVWKAKKHLNFGNEATAKQATATDTELIKEEPGTKNATSSNKDKALVED